MAHLADAYAYETTYHYYWQVNILNENATEEGAFKYQTIQSAKTSILVYMGWKTI